MKLDWVQTSKLVYVKEIPSINQKFKQKIKFGDWQYKIRQNIIFFLTSFGSSGAGSSILHLPSCASMCIYYYSKLTFWHVFWIRDLKIIFCQKITVIFILGDHPKPPASLRFDQKSRPQNWPFGDLMTKYNALR